MNHLKASAVVVGICLLGFLGWWVWQNQKAPEGQAGEALSLAEMEKSGVPVLSGTDIFGQSFSSSDAKGKILIVNFWASWCAPCIQEVPSLVRLVKEFDGKIKVLAISEDTNTDDIQVFLKSFPDFKSKDISIHWDADHSFMRRFAVQALPESFVIDGQSKVVKKITGTIDWYTDDAKSYLKSILSEKK